MKLPIILYDNGDVNVFHAVQDAENYIESPDVLDGTYEAYDSEGRRLDLIIPKSRKLKILSLEITKVDKVKIKKSSDKKIYTDRLSDILVEFLRKQSVPDKFIKNASLNDLIVKCSEILKIEK
jgi:hypothetical protein